MKYLVKRSADHVFATEAERLSATGVAVGAIAVDLDTRTAWRLEPGDEWSPKRNLRDPVFRLHAELHGRRVTHSRDLPREAVVIELTPECELNFMASISEKVNSGELTLIDEEPSP